MKKIKQTVEKINDSKGFVSIEYAIICGVVVALGIVITYFLATKGRGLASITGGTLDDLNSKLGGQNIGNGASTGGSTSGNTNTSGNINNSGETDSNSSQTNKSKVTKGADGKYYQNGSLFTGVNPDDNKTYKNGEPLTGVSDTDGKYYKNGEPFTGTIDGKSYKDGVEDTSSPTDSPTYTGYKDDGQHYTNGVKDTTDAWDFDFINGDEDGTIIITGYYGSNPDVVIPSKINNKKVVGIGERAFDANLYNGHASVQITSVILPNTLQFIDDLAFNVSSSSSGGLTSVVIPEGVTSIGENAFRRNSLKTVEIAGTVKTIGAIAFSENKITNLTIKNGVETIENNAFSYNSISSLTLPASIKKVAADAFSYNNITHLDLSQLSNSVVFEDDAIRLNTPELFTTSPEVIWWPNATKPMNIFSKDDKGYDYQGKSN